MHLQKPRGIAWFRQPRFLSLERFIAANLIRKESYMSRLLLDFKRFGRVLKGDHSAIVCCLSEVSTRRSCSYGSLRGSATLRLGGSYPASRFIGNLMWTMTSGQTLR